MGGVMKRFAVVLTVLVGCAAQPPSPEESAKADYGPYPTNYLAIINANMQATLRDPASAMYTKPKAPVKSWAGVREKQFGWATCIGVNAKNGYGGYTGTNTYFYLIRNGAVVEVQRTGSSSNKYNDEYVHDLCNRLI